MLAIDQFIESLIKEKFKMTYSWFSFEELGLALPGG